MPSKGVGEMYDELLRYYSSVSLVPKRALERAISERVSAGMTREEAIADLYRELLGPRVSGAAAAEPKGLEAALAELRAMRSNVRLVFLALFLVYIALIPLFMASPGAAVAIISLLSVVSVVASIAASRAKLRWEFSEELVVEGAAEHLGEVLREVPHVFQELTLQSATCELSEGGLSMALRLERVAAERDSPGARLVDLGPFRIQAEFSRRDGDLVVRVRYSGEPPAAHADVAAGEYERVIVAFRSAVREAWERVRPRRAVSIDFVELARLIASTGVVVKAVKCPNCGGNVDLPESGDAVKCPYCGATIKAIDVYEMVKGLLRELR